MGPKAPCTHIVHTSASKYLYRDPFKAQVSTTKVHGGFGGGGDVRLRETGT